MGGAILFRKSCVVLLQRCRVFAGTIWPVEVMNAWHNTIGRVSSSYFTEKSGRSFQMPEGVTD